jgi:hypothetical protein
VISPAALATAGRQPDNVALDVRPACQMIRSGFPLSKDPFCRRRSIAARTSAFVNPPGGRDERVAAFCQRRRRCGLVILLFLFHPSRGA